MSGVQGTILEVDDLLGEGWEWGWGGHRKRYRHDCLNISNVCFVFGGPHGWVLHNHFLNVKTPCVRDNLLENRVFNLMWFKKKTK